MKSLLLPGLLLGLPSATQAQVLPIPGAKNPDWKLLTSQAQRTQFRSADRMPNATLGVSGIGNHHYSWDASRQLRYEWDSRPGSTEPADSVTVHEDATGTIYAFRRQASAPAKPRQWRRLTPAK